MVELDTVIFSLLAILLGVLGQKKELVQVGGHSDECVLLLSSACAGQLSTRYQVFYLQISSQTMLEW